MFLFDGDSLQFIQSQIGPYGLYITDIKKDSSGNIWMAVGLGGWGTLVKYDGNSFSGFPPVATAIEFDSEGNLWIGTESFTFDAEIIKYDGANWTSYNPSNSQMPVTIMITDLAFDKLGNLWVGTLDAGLLIFNENGIVPVELVSFFASANVNNVKLNWVTSTETNNMGFEVERLQNYKITKLQDWEKIGFVEGKGTTTERQFYSFVDKNLNSGKYHYRLKQIDFDGTFEYSKVMEVEVNAPLEFSLSQNFPNPFNPITKIRYEIPGQARNDNIRVILKVYDVLGNEVATLINDEKQSGVYEVEFDGSELSSGLYLYKFKAGSFTKTMKMIYLK